MKQPRGAWLGHPRDHDGRAKPRSTIAAVVRQSDPDDVRGAGLEALGNEASPRERCPRGRGASVSHRTVQARVYSKDKTARDGTEPENENNGTTAGGKAQPLRERADLKLLKGAQPTAGGQETTMVPQTQGTQ